MFAKPIIVCLLGPWCCSLSRAQSPQGTPPNNFEGRPAPQNFNAEGPRNRDVIPQFIAAIRPARLRRAGRIAAEDSFWRFM